MRPYFFILLLFPLFTNAQIITTYVGGGSGGGIDGIGDGLHADSAKLGVIVYAAFDTAGNLYIPDPAHYRIRKVDKKTGIITSIAGNGTTGFSGDSGLATAAEFTEVGYITFDSKNNLYLSDINNQRVRKVNATTGIITTIAGTGTAGFSGDSGLATAAELNYPAGLCFDKFGNLYISDNYNERIRKVNTSGIITTYVGTGLNGFSGDGGLADTAMIWDTRQMCTDTAGNLYIGDIGNSRVRKIDAITHIITTIVGTGDSAFYNGDGIAATTATIDPFGIAIDKNGYLFIGDHVNNRIRKIDALGIIHTVAGDGIQGFAGDGGSADSAKFYYPQGIAFDSCNNLYIADNANKRVRKVTFDTSCGKQHGDTSNMVNSVQANNKIKIYPNPATNTLQITISNWQPGKNSNYLLMDITGRILLNGEITSSKQQIDIHQLANGIYLIQINSGQQKIIQKLIKE